VPIRFEATDVAPTGKLLDGAPKTERQTNRNKY